MAIWNLSPANKKVLVSLIDDHGNGSQSLLSLKKRDTLTFGELKVIKDNLSTDAPFFTLFNNLVVHCEQSEYKASAAFRVHTEKLRRQQENAQYTKMVQSVDPGQKYGKTNHMENFGAEMRTVNRQLMSVLNVLITVVGAFFFGFSGVTFIYPHLNLDIGTRFLIGLVLATIVFFADLYFVIKSMDEDYEDEADASPFKNSHNLNFREVTKKAPKSTADKKNE